MRRKKKELVLVLLLLFCSLLGKGHLRCCGRRGRSGVRLVFGGGRSGVEEGRERVREKGSDRSAERRSDAGLEAAACCSTNHPLSPSLLSLSSISLFAQRNSR
jgi:hypothetical protein